MPSAKPCPLKQRFFGVPLLLLLTCASCSGTDPSAGMAAAGNGNGELTSVGADSNQVSVAAASSVPATPTKTALLNANNLISDLAYKPWMLANVPLLELDSSDAVAQKIQDVYFYRWTTLKRALRYTNEANGYVFLEFIFPPGYGGPFGAINCASGHHLSEARWLHNARYATDYLNFWLTGAGQSAAHSYNDWLVDAAYGHLLVNYDLTTFKSLAPGLAAHHAGFNSRYVAASGLYASAPNLDGTEYAAPSYSSQNPDHDAYQGGSGFRGTFNSYQYASALALASIANHLLQDSAAEANYLLQAQALQAGVQSQLWVANHNAFIHRYSANNALFTDQDPRELASFVPWAFGLPEAKYDVSWQNLLGPASSFATPTGMTSLSTQSSLYLYNYTLGTCCHWNGPVWPFNTSLVLRGMGRLIRQNRQSFVTADDFVTQLGHFAAGQYKNGVPYIAEALDANQTRTTPLWAYDTPGHSEHYNHSSFVDLVIAQLVGVQPRLDDVFELAPLANPNWRYFALENIAYHGHFFTVLWDADGSRYGKGAGLSVLQNGALLHQQPTLAPLQVAIAHGSQAPVQQVRAVNAAIARTGSATPTVTASYTFSVDTTGELNDGIIFYDNSSSANNSRVRNRWTNYNSPNASDSLVLDMNVAQNMNSVTLHVYDDGAGVRPPTAVQVLTSQDNATFSAVGDLAGGQGPFAAGPVTLTFTPVTARYLKLIFANQPSCAASNGGCVGLTELEVWVAP